MKNKINKKYDSFNCNYKYPVFINKRYHPHHPGKSEINFRTQKIEKYRNACCKKGVYYNTTDDKI